jgi:hypothetical protein
MASKDKFTIRLQCPTCEQTGEADCWQEDGWAFAKGAQGTTVTSVSPGFTRVKKSSFWGGDINFVCDECRDLCARE